MIKIIIDNMVWNEEKKLKHQNLKKSIKN